MGWFLVNIALPLCAPLVVLSILRGLPVPAESRHLLNMLIPVKDGQLCWAAIALAASALYEIAIEKGSPSSIAVGYLQGVATFVIAASSIVAAGGAMYPTPLVRPIQVGWLRHYSTFVISLILAVWAAAARALVQFGL